MIEDKRSRKIIAVSHCVLNQNSKLEGIASWPGIIEPVLKVISKSGAGILQIPCPEMMYEGIGRFDKSYEQYRCAAFTKLCNDIAEDVVDQIESYLGNGYRILAVLAIDGSPTCGYTLTQSAPEWKGLVAGSDIRKARYVKEKGVFMDILERRFLARSIKIPFLGIPEVSEIGSIEKALAKLQALLR